MIHIYYHIYVIDGIELIIDEQLSLIEKHFDFPYTLNVGIAIALPNFENENISTSKILEKFTKSNYKIRDVRARGNEFTTLDLIEKDKEKFGDSDYILYIHTKGASRQNEVTYKNIESWRHIMNYFNIEKVKNVFKIFEKTEFNTYGVLFNDFYMGNFWWMRGDYAKTIHLENIDKSNRYKAEVGYLGNGIDWKPYSAYNIESRNPYSFQFKKEEYAK
jgi:hypothetical protein